MSAAQAHDYHAAQIEVLADTEADMLCVQALDHPEEAIGIAQAAEHAQMPVAIGFSVDASGHLPGGLALREAIEQVDTQTERYPLYYLINCAHPSHAQQALLGDPGPWRERLRGLRVSALTHIEQDSTAVPGNGDPEVLASTLCATAPANGPPEHFWWRRGQSSSVGDRQDLVRNAIARS